MSIMDDLNEIVKTGMKNLRIRTPSVMEELERLADDAEVNALGREELIKAEHEFEFSVGYVMGLRKAIELMSKEKITKEMIENWLGTDTDIRELLSELANGEYKAEEFKQDVIDTWQEENV